VLTHLKDRVAAIIQTFHSGSEGRTAIAEVLAGAVNPSARTPMSFPRSVGQIPVHYDHLPTGRPETPGRFRYESIFMDEKNEPLYPFGHGLSYTRFTYAGLIAETPSARIGQDVVVSVDVTNSGARDGQEVVQAYVRQPVASISRPVRQLKGFEKIALKAGETRRVTFRIPADSLGYHDAQGRYRVEPGRFEVFVGGSSLASLNADFAVIPAGRAAR
jgi:beta-glucosidase